jgi:hypothetical protein
MVQSVTRVLLLGLAAWVVGLLTQTSAVAAGDEGAALMLQPQGLNRAGVYAVRELEPGLRGSGVKFAVICRSMSYVDSEPQNDYQPNTNHNCLKGREFGFHDQEELAPGSSAHSTAVCSILFGEEENAFGAELGSFHYQGVAPDAEADVYEFWHFVINNVFQGLPPDADIITASIGNQFEHSWTRGIESLSEQYGLIVVAAIGNGLNVHDPLLYPGAGANAIGVGVVDSVNVEDAATSLAHFALAYPEHSSFGPTSDGRCKPDIIAPGNCLAAADNEPNRYEATGSWSSFSTPIAAGTVGLLLQKARQDTRLSGAAALEGGDCVLKAILMNSATKLAYWHKGRLEKDDDHTAPLDYIQGAGMLNGLEAYRHLTAGEGKPGIVGATGWDNNYVKTTEEPERSYQITIGEPADKVITATLVWKKHYESIYPFEPLPEKDTDLRLEIWAVDPNNPENDYLLDYSDSAVDNVEHIYGRMDANYTHYEIVLATNDIDDPNETGTAERYGLAWNVSDVGEGDSIFRYDLNADGIVDDMDFTALLDNWITVIRTPGWYFLGDMDANGIFDENDFQMLLDNVNLEADWRTR